MKILVIDDSKFIHKSFAQYLKAETNIELFELLEGQNAVPVSKDVMPDLIFLDYILVNTNGLHVLKELKKEEATKHIPVLMISSKENHYDQEMTLLHGAEEYIQKPLHKEVILEKISTYQKRLNKSA